MEPSIALAVNLASRTAMGHAVLSDAVQPYELRLPSIPSALVRTSVILSFLYCAGAQAGHGLFDLKTSIGSTAGAGVTSDSNDVLVAEPAASSLFAFASLCS